MKQRRSPSRTAHLFAVVALIGSTFGVGLALAPPAAAAGTWQNPGNWSFVNVDGALIIGGTGSDPGLFSMTSPTECNNGTNDDPNNANPGKPSNYQDANYDFGSVPADAECASALDDSEVAPGLQTRTPFQINGAVAAGGAITVAAPATDVIVPPIFKYINQTNLPTVGTLNGRIAVTIAATSASGNLDPATGLGTISLGLNITFTITTGFGFILPATVTCDPTAVTISATTGTSGGLTGVNYSSTNGLGTLVDNTFTVPAVTGTGLVPAQLCPAIGGALGLPSAPGASTLRLQTRILPNPALAQPIVTGVTPAVPATVPEGTLMNLTPTATDQNTSLCASPCVPTKPNPSWNWRWTQTGAPAGGNVADATIITTPAGTRILNNVDKVTGRATFLIPKAGTYTFRIDAGNGATLAFGTSFTQTIVATAVTPVVNAGPALTASAGQPAATNPVKLVATVTSPAPADAAGRTYAWTKAGTSTCAAGDVTFTTPATISTSFATSAAPTPANCFVDAVMTVTVNGKVASGTVRINIKSTVASTISGNVTACTASCVPLGVGAANRVYAFTQPTNTPILSAPTDAVGNFSIPVTNGVSYKLYYAGAGVAAEWFGGRLNGTSKTLLAPYAGANKTLNGGATAAGTLNATANSQAGGTVPDGTKVRLYDSAGLYWDQMTTVAGAASFASLPTGNYKVDFGPGSLTHKEVWADNGFNPSSATAKLVTSGGGPTAVVMSLPLRNLNTNFQFLHDGGVASASAANTLTGPAGTAWAVNQWAGFRVNIYGGRDGSTGGNATKCIKVIASNTANVITTATNWTVAPGCVQPEAGVSTFQILPGRLMSNATAAAATTLDDTTQAWVVNSLVGFQVKILFATGGCSGACTGRITSNTATQITIAPGFTTIPAVNDGYQIIPLQTNGNGAISGWASTARTGAAVPPGVDKEARVYNAATGTFVGKVNVVGTSAPLGSISNFSFLKWTADPVFPLGQGGLPAGNYKVLLRIIGAGGGAPAFCSQWAGSGYSVAAGGPAYGGWASASAFTVVAGANTNASMVINQDANCTAGN